MDTIDKKIISILQQDARTPLKRSQRKYFSPLRLFLPELNDWKRKEF